MRKEQADHNTLTAMQEVLQQYVPVIQSWVTEDGHLPDPYETTYSENYAPANAAAVLASVCHSGGDLGAGELLDRMLSRTVELLEDKQNVNPFCRVFLYHYSLLALLLAPEAERSRLLQRYGSALAAYEDDCPVVNTNCAALQWSMELFADALGLRLANEQLLRHRLQFIERAQLHSGFINDEVNEEESLDGMPIAYHAFTLFLLTSAFAVIEQWPSSLKASKAEAERIVLRGTAWLRQAIAPDGTFAMVERSGYQMFVWGAVTALLAATIQDRNDESLMSESFRSWLSYRHDDGTYSCTANHLPHSLRAGYEQYTHLNMYNLLGLSGIAIAARLLERRIRLGDSLLEAGSEKLQHHPAGASHAYIDYGSGYAFYRQGDDFFGCTLRMHNRRYTPAIQGFHFRLAGQKMPIAEPRLPGSTASAERAVQDGVWEGFLLLDQEGNVHYPNALSNAEAVPAEDGLTLISEGEWVRCSKTITMRNGVLRWRYQLIMKRPITSCQHVIPLVVHDGRHPLRVMAKEECLLLMQHDNRSYELRCDDASSIRMELNRSLLSASGASAQVCIHIAESLAADSVIEWETSCAIV
ncbi:hypothetical protein [Paenibacillus chungangensis]|uniref:Heparinase n=1 Tax=Paenibacillus chungangensis TaxID=696535 RepID=A0ABW3HNS5_9BACL